MLRRFLIGFILFTMMLHSASRLGVLSFLYQQRLEIAYTLGMIDEVPITTCSHEYDFNPGLKIVSADDQNGSLPPIALQAREITLFFTDNLILSSDVQRLVVDATPRSPFLERRYDQPSLSIFHPPA